MRRVVRVSHFCPNLIYGAEVFPQPADRLFTEVMSYAEEKELAERYERGSRHSRRAAPAQLVPNAVG